MCLRIGEIIQEKNGEILLGGGVKKIESSTDEIVVHTSSDSIQTAYLINCAGLHSDRITELGGEQSQAKIIPFKGEYFELTDDSKHLCKNLIYPVPDPEFPFLGVHFTRMIDNSVECGPNAVLAF